MESTATIYVINDAVSAPPKQQAWANAGRACHGALASNSVGKVGVSSHGDVSPGGSALDGLWRLHVRVRDDLRRPVAKHLCVGGDHA